MALDDGGTGNYNGLLLSVQKRVGKASAQANYTWGHCISDSWSSIFAGSSSVFPDNRRANRSNCATSDIRQVFNLTTVLQSPNFSSRPALSKLAAGWQLSSLMRIRSAQLFTVTSGVDAALSGEGGQRPNLLRDPYSPTKNADHWIDASAFAAPPPGSYGNLGAYNLKGPGVFQFDMGLTRTFTIQEGRTLQFRAEAFNILNKVNLSTPVSALNSGAFGKIQSAGDPRILQMAMKLVF